MFDYAIDVRTLLQLDRAIAEVQSQAKRFQIILDDVIDGSSYATVARCAGRAVFLVGTAAKIRVDG